MPTLAGRRACGLLASGPGLIPSCGDLLPFTAFVLLTQRGWMVSNHGNLVSVPPTPRAAQQQAPIGATRHAPGSFLLLGPDQEQRAGDASTLRSRFRAPLRPGCQPTTPQTLRHTGEHKR